MPTLKRRIRLFYGPFAFPIALVLAIILLEEAVGLTIPWVQGRLFKHLFDRAAAPVAGFAALGVALWALLNCIGHLRWRYNYTRISQPLKMHIMRLTLERITALSLAQHLDRHSGVKQSTIWEGQKALESLMRTLVFEIAPMVVEIAAVIVLLAMGHWLLAALVILGGVLFALRAYRMNLVISGPLKQLKEEGLRESKFRNDVMRNMELVQVTAQEPRAVRETCDSYGRILESDGDIWLPYNIRAMLRDLLIVATRAAVLAAGIWLVWRGYADIGALLTWSVWTSTVTHRISNIGWLWRDIMSDLASVRVFLELLEMEPDVREAPSPVHLPRFTGRIEFDDVWLSYASRTREPNGDDDEPTPRAVRESLRGVTLTIEPGQRVAFVGPSGAGKSTLVYALMRGQDPDRGAIRVDGVDLRDLPLRHWRGRVGIVPQQVFLFDKSLRYNVTWPLDDGMAVSEERLERAVDMACLRDRVEGLEYRYDTEIGERGIRVSGGERQRVGIARALIAEPDVLIFDEATSNLDAINERLIHEAIRTAGEGRTTVIIAHRLSTVRDADRIFVMDAGRIVGQGTHEELMTSCDVYRELVEHQMPAA